MKTQYVILISILSALLYSSCSNNNAAIPTSPQVPNPGLKVSIAGYGQSIDSTFYKVWSDSSWEEFLMDTTISGTVYSVVMDNGGNEYFYSPSGNYSGFWLYGGSLIMFDSALVSLPDTLVEGQAYTRQTTFSYQGASYTFGEQDAILDTTTVSVPFGTFSDCPVLQSTQIIQGAGQSTGGITVYWLAKGPSDVYRQYNTGSLYGYPYSIYMAYGVVNDIGWGVVLSKALPSVRERNRGTSLAEESPRRSVGQTPLSINSIAPMILRGIRR